MSKLKEIKKQKILWEQEELRKTLDKYPERKDSFTTSYNKEIDRLYTPDSFENQDYLQDEGFPGLYPFTRGIQPTMHRGKLWTMRQYAGFGTAKETNERFRYLLNEGQTGLSVAFDLPTQLGYDSDNKLATGEVGKVGVSIDTLADMEILFDELPLDKISTSMTINATAPILLAMYTALAEKRGINKKKLRGTVQNDILKEYAARGTYIYPPEQSIKLTTDIFEYCSQNIPGWNTISISGYHIREAGATAVQEIAFTLSNAIEYVKSAVDKGLDVDSFAPRLSFFFNAHNKLLEEIAKFRAARRLWANIMKNRFKAANPASMKLRFHTQTAGSTLTAQQPRNNIMRVCIQALAAVLGGTQSLHTNSWDEALSLPSEESALLALRTQQIIAGETDVASTVDPLGGSYAIESLTSDIESEALKYIEKIDQMGGARKAIEEGFIQREIQNSAYEYQKAIENKTQEVVGINSYISGENKSNMNLHKADPEVEVNQVKKLSKVKSIRDSALVKECLSKLKDDAREGKNVMPRLVEASKLYATLQEMADVLRDCYGEFNSSGI